MKKICVMALIGTLVFSGVSVVPAAAVSAETVQEAVEEPVQTSEKEEAVSVISSPGCTCQDGDDIYYAYEMQGLRLGIMKYNTKTGEKTEVYSYKIGESDSNGFYQLSVDEKYIYAVWDRAYGTEVSKTYIYRISKDGKSAKKLAIGRDPIVSGDRIYYIGSKIDKIPGMGTRYTRDNGYLMSMKKDGTDQKKEKRLFRENKNIFYFGTLYQLGDQVLYSKDDEDNIFYDLEGKKYNRKDYAVKDDDYLVVGNRVVSDGIYDYRAASKKDYSYTRIYRTNRNTGEKNLVAYFPRGIMRYSINNGYVFVQALIPYEGAKKDVTEKQAVYCIKADGSRKTKLVSWFPAE